MCPGKLSGWNGKVILLKKTILLNLTFLISQGIGEGMRGPTLLDLADIYDTSIDALSLIYVFLSIGALIGSIWVGHLLDTFPHHRNLILFLLQLSNGVLTMLIPSLGHKYILYGLSLLAGMVSSGISVACNVICLQIWKGRDGCGPAIHSLQFSFATGSFLAPLASAPFLSERENDDQNEKINITMPEDYDVGGGSNHRETQVSKLYLIVGIATALLSLGHLYFEFQSIKKRRKIADGHVEEEEEEEEKEKMKNGQKQKWSVCLFLIVTIATAISFFSVSVVFAMSAYLTTFAVECSLHLTKVQGAVIVAIFWASNAAMKFAGIFMAIFLNPLTMMAFNFTFAFSGTSLMLFFAEHSITLLQVCSGLIGAAFATTPAALILWLEQYVAVTGKICALFAISTKVGQNVYPFIVGQYIMSRPLILVYLPLVTVLVCITLLFVAMCLGRVASQERETVQ